jgi:predicted methyltransferase
MSVRQAGATFSRLVLIGFVAAFAGCGNPPEDTAPAAAMTPDLFDEAVAHPDRPAADRVRDANSRPAEVLRFFDTPTEGVIVDLFAGGGYYSEILSRVLGEKGTVFLHNNQAYLEFMGEEVVERLAGDSLPNVIRYDRELDSVDLADDSVDMILMVMTYHDLYFKTDEWDIDADSFFATARRILKPGGILAIVDHVAVPKSGSSAAQELHRIDPAFARKDIESRGFELVAESDLLLNPEDSLEVNVFDPSIRGSTSRFIYKFVEPAG